MIRFVSFIPHSGVGVTLRRLMWYDGVGGTFIYSGSFPLHLKTWVRRLIWAGRDTSHKLFRRGGRHWGKLPDNIFSVKKAMSDLKQMLFLSIFKRPSAVTQHQNQACSVCEGQGFEGALWNGVKPISYQVMWRIDFFFFSNDSFTNSAGLWCWRFAETVPPTTYCIPGPIHIGEKWILWSNDPMFMIYYCMLIARSLHVSETTKPNPRFMHICINCFSTAFQTLSC